MLVWFGAAGRESGRRTAPIMQQIATYERLVGRLEVSIFESAGTDLGFYR